MSVPQTSTADPAGRPNLDGPTAIVAAMAEELAPLVSRSHVRRKLRLGHCRVYVARLGKAEVVLASTGEGRHLAEQGLQAVLDAFPARRVIVIGVAGGLSPGLATGSVIVAGRVRTAEEVSPLPDRPLRECAVRFPAAREGTVLSSKTILCTAESKSEAWGAIARDAPAVVDLESAAWAKVTTDAGLPYLVLRAVCDPAEETLPIDLNTCLDETGRVSRVEVFQQAVLSPSIVRRLLDLRRRVALSANNLASLVDALLNERIS